MAHNREELILTGLRFLLETLREQYRGNAKEQEFSDHLDRLAAHVTEESSIRETAQPEGKNPDPKPARRPSTTTV